MTPAGNPDGVNSRSARPLAWLMVAGFFFPACANMTCSQERRRAIERLNSGVSYYRQGQLPGAVREFKSAIAEDDAYVMAHYNLAKVYQDMKNWEQAAAELRRCMEIEPGNPTYHYDLGVALQETGRPERAGAEYARALELDPKLYRVHYRMGTLHERGGRPREADSSYRRSIEINPRFTKAIVGLGNLYLDNGYANLAAQVFQAGVTVDDGDAEAHNGLGKAYHELGDTTRAIPEFKKAVEIDGELLSAVYNLGMAFAALDQREAARRWLERFVQAGTGRTDPAFVRAAQDKMSDMANDEASGAEASPPKQ